MFGSRETLNSLILKAPQEWHTQVALPFVRIEGTTVEWDELRFDVRLLQRVPYEGAPLALPLRPSRSFAASRPCARQASAACKLRCAAATATASSAAASA